MRSMLVCGSLLRGKDRRLIFPIKSREWGSFYSFGLADSHGGQQRVESTHSFVTTNDLAQSVHARLGFWSCRIG